MIFGVGKVNAQLRKRPVFEDFHFRDIAIGDLTQYLGLAFHSLEPVFANDKAGRTEKQERAAAEKYAGSNRNAGANDGEPPFDKSDGYKPDPKKQQ